jgi:alcohol dehydrogenase class IV
LNKTQKIAFPQLAELEKGQAVIWTVPELVDQVRKKFSREPVIFPAEPTLPATFVIAVGGGTLIDFAKIWRKKKAPQAKLAAIPSLWGSGAENSPVAVLNTPRAKEIVVGEAYLPEFRLIWEELASAVPCDMALYGCGDTWSHALEAFLSPLASPGLRMEVSHLLQRMLEMPLGRDPRWFELSALACAAQAASSVGLVHGIAHTIEIRLKAAFSNEFIGHSRLCSLYLWPVMRFNQQASNMLATLFSQSGLDTKRVFVIIQGLFHAGDYERFLPILAESWNEIVRNRLTRTNSVLVRPNHLEYFLQTKFL